MVFKVSFLLDFSVILGTKNHFEHKKTPRDQGRCEFAREYSIPNVHTIIFQSS